MNFNLILTKKPMLETTRIVLTEPFVRHAAGHVFELNAAIGVSGWEEDERLRERLIFSNKQTYFLPDGGNGVAFELSINATRPCPSGVFENIDLRTGPCRVTGSTFSSDSNEARAQPSSIKHQVKLFEINGVNAQGIEMSFEHKPSKIVLTDVLRSETLREISADSNSPLLDFADLLPGFYQLTIAASDGSAHFLRIFKAFPLLVIFQDRSDRFSTQKTMY